MQVKRLTRGSHSKELPRQFIARVENCTRCGGTHDTVFTQFVKPPWPWTHYGQCENTREPLLICSKLKERDGPSPRFSSYPKTLRRSLEHIRQMMKYLTGLLGILVISTFASAQQLQWHTDYGSGMRRAKKLRKDMVVYFHGGQDQLGPRLRSSEKLKSRAAESVLVKIPVNTRATVGGEVIKLIDHSSFRELESKTGIAIVDFSSEKYFGKVVSIYPLTYRQNYSPTRLLDLFGLPDASLTQRTIILAVRIHPENPASTHGRMSSYLADEAQSHSEHQASIQLQGHHNWDNRFRRIVGNTGGSSAQEVCAESWEGKGLFAAAIDCVHSWRQSSGHWGAVRRRHDLYGYDMKRGANGIWYATGIFASR